MSMNPDYPIYIISKGRADSRLTSKALEKMNVPYRIVVEPQEFDAYAAVIAPEKVIALPFSNLGLGAIPARNFVWEHAKNEGWTRHWILDDNISGFYRLNYNLKVEVLTGAIFKAAEDFCERYENIALAGFNYFMFAKRKDELPPYVLNTRIYSCILIRNVLPERWRGRYNEDTDLSLRVLKAGWCTVQFNAFLQCKATTMTMAGGNTDELYAGDGRERMADSLVEQHPDCAKKTWKFGRWHHTVDYKRFRRTQLIRRHNYPTALSPIDNYGMVLRVEEPALCL